MSTTHRTRDGKVMKIRDMTDSHLYNTIMLIERKAKEGVTVLMGGGTDSDDMWMDEEVLYDEDVLKYMNYEVYKKEWERRKKIKKGVHMKVEIKQAKDVKVGGQHLY